MCRPLVVVAPVLELLLAAIRREADRLGKGVIFRGALGIDPCLPAGRPDAAA